MYLSEVSIENFRLFGSKDDGRHLDLKLQPGLNVLVGENESGKSAVVDAIRLVLLTTSREFNWLREDDFHVSGSERAYSLALACTLRGLSEQETCRFLEWLTTEDDNEPCLIVNLQAMRVVAGTDSRRDRIAVKWHSGRNGAGPAIEGEIREFLKTTYLRPLRDAEAELSGGRGSRLSQILQAHPDCRAQSECNLDEDAPESWTPSTLVEIMRQAEYLIRENPFIRAAEADLNEQYLQDLSIGGDVLTGEIGIARKAELRHILEKLELWLQPRAGVNLRTPRGLGVNNVLFMATELLLLGGDEHALPLLLIEEPEAHLHPQMQLRLMEFLEGKSGGGDDKVQILMTTHSPNIASKVDLGSVVVMCGTGQAYSLNSSATKLEPSDYRFLRRFLDVTKANLFFAKAVVIVEGDAENILLPTLAKLIGRSFSEHGVSIVNVGSRGLFRYARIFQREDGTVMPTRVACIADRDIPPDVAEDFVEKRKDGPTFESEYGEDKIQEEVQRLKASDADPVRTFVSPKWTLEHDLAFCGFARPLHSAIQLAKKARSKAGGTLSPEEKSAVIAEAGETATLWENEGWTPDVIAASVYQPLRSKQASKPEAAQFLAEILEDDPISAGELRERLPQYLVEAIDYVTSTTA